MRLMKRPALSIEEKPFSTKGSTGESILIIDKEGILGNALSEKLQEECLTVLVSGKEPKIHTDNLIFIPFRKKIPTIPTNIYSHIFVVQNKSLLETGLLFEFIKKAKADRARFIFVISLFEEKEELTKKIYDSYKESYIVIFGDLFGKDLPMNESLINRFLYQAKEEGKILLSDMGLGKTPSVFFDDAIDSILSVAFGVNLPSKTLFLFPKHAPTALSVSRMIQKINPLLKIDFVKESKEIPNKRKTAFKEEGEYLLADDYPILERIKQTYNSLSLKALPSKKSFKENSFRRFPRFTIYYLLFTIFTILLLPVFASILLFILGGWQLESTKKAIEAENLPLAYESATSAKVFFDLAQNGGRVVSLEAGLLHKEDAALFFTNNIYKGQEISRALASTLKAANIVFGVFKGTSSNPTEDFSTASFLLKEVVSSIQALKVEGLGSQELKMMQKFDSQVQFLARTIDVFPNLFGFEGKRLYLLLFQNNMELRPGGGFIGSYGLLTLDKGRVKDFSIHDIYDADGQLRGHVEPPFALRRHMLQPHWSLRDSNFDVDFPKNASNAAFFLNEETGQAVDGVIGVDVSFVKKILEVLGPVYVSDYKETVSKDNLYLLTQSHAEKNFFPGSTAKKDFLRSLFRAIEDKFSQETKLPYLALLKIVENSISQKHLLFAFGESSLGNLFTVNKMSSSLWDDREDAQNKINDFLGVSEANIGANKANYFIKRKISQEMRLDEEGSISGRLTVYYKNTSDGWPGGDYKNYFRLILPLGADLTSVEIDGDSQTLIPAVTDPSIYEKKNFQAPKGLEIEKTVQEQKTIYGFLLVVPAGALKKVKISYLLPQKISPVSPSFSYSLYIFKQPGTEEYPYSFSLSSPKNFRLVNGEPSFSNVLTNDLELRSSFAQK